MSFVFAGVRDVDGDKVDTIFAAFAVEDTLRQHDILGPPLRLCAVVVDDLQHELLVTREGTEVLLEDVESVEGFFRFFKVRLGVADDFIVAVTLSGQLQVRFVSPSVRKRTSEEWSLSCSSQIKFGSEMSKSLALWKHLFGLVQEVENEGRRWGRFD